MTVEEDMIGVSGVMRFKTLITGDVNMYTFERDLKNRYVLSFVISKYENPPNLFTYVRGSKKYTYIKTGNIKNGDKFRIYYTEVEDMQLFRCQYIYMSKFNKQKMVTLCLHNVIETGLLDKSLNDVNLFLQKFFIDAIDVRLDGEKLEYILYLRYMQKNSDCLKSIAEEIKGSFELKDNGTILCIV